MFLQTRIEQFSAWWKLFLASSNIFCYLHFCIVVIIVLTPLFVLASLFDIDVLKLIKDFHSGVTKNMEAKISKAKQAQRTYDDFSDKLMIKKFMRYFTKISATSNHENLKNADFKITIHREHDDDINL